MEGYWKADGRPREGTLRVQRSPAKVLVEPCLSLEEALGRSLLRACRPAGWSLGEPSERLPGDCRAPGMPRNRSRMARDASEVLRCAPGSSPRPKAAQAGCRAHGAGVWGQVERTRSGMTGRTQPIGTAAHSNCWLHRFVGRLPFLFPTDVHKSPASPLDQEQR